MVSLFDAKTEHDVIQALKRGENINQIRRGITPLYTACEKGNVEVVDALLNHGANPHVLTHAEIIGPIQIAALNGYVNIIKRLIRVGISINNCLNRGGTLLYYASMLGHIDVIDFLISHGADVNFLSYPGTALMAACYYDCRQI